MRIAPLAMAVVLAIAGTTATTGTASADGFLVEPPKPEKKSMKPALIATAIFGAVVAGTVATYVKFHGRAEHQHTRDLRWSDPKWPEKQAADAAAIETWRDRTLLGLALTVVTGAATGYMWSSRESAPSVNITPMSGGMRVAIDRTF